MSAKFNKGKIKRSGTYLVNRDDSFEVVYISYSREGRIWWEFDYPNCRASIPFENDGTTEWIRLGSM